MKLNDVHWVMQDVVFMWGFLLGIHRNTAEVHRFLQKFCGGVPSQAESRWRILQHHVVMSDKYIVLFLLFCCLIVEVPCVELDR